MRDQQSASRRPWRVARYPIASVVAAAAMVAAASVGSAAGGWSAVSSPKNGGENGGGPDGVSCLSSTFCMGVGAFFPNSEYYIPSADIWNGSTWTPTPPPHRGEESGLVSVSCTSQSFCMAVGEYDNYYPERTLAEIWNGARWSALASPNKTTQDNLLSSVSCTSSSNCLAVGFYSYGPNDIPLALAEKWDGSAWSITPAPARSNDSFLDGVSCTGANSCMAVGVYVNSSRAQATLMEAWNGSAWSVVASPNRPLNAWDNYLNGVSCTSPSQCVAVGEAGSTNPSTPISQTLVESWNGSTWSITPSPTPSPTTLAELQAVSCVNSVSCVAVGSNENSAAGTDFSLIETWNGSVWSITPHPDSSYGYFYGVSCASSSVCLAVGYPEEVGPA